MVETPQVIAVRRSFTRLARFFNQLLREKLTCGPLTVQQFHALEALAEGPLTMSELAREVGLHQSTVTRIVDRLVRDGCVERKRGEREKRRVEVTLTGEGRALYRQLDGECASFAARLLEIFPDGRRNALVDSLEEMSRSISPENEKFREILRACCDDGKEARA